MNKAKQLLALVEGSKEIKDFVKEIGSDLLYDGINLKGTVYLNSEDEANYDNLEVKRSEISNISNLLSEWGLESKELLNGIKGKSFPFSADAYIEDQDGKGFKGSISGNMKILGTKYDESKDRITITKSNLEDLEYEL
jgi:hypothetical protein